MSWRQAALLICTLPVFAAAPAELARSDDAVVERGAFRLHLYKKPTGLETYEIRRDGDGLVLKASSANTDRGVREPLEAVLRLRADHTPEHFEVKGKTSRFSEMDCTVRVEGRTATVREGAATAQRSVPDRWFCVAGFGPVSVQMMLVRDWERNPATSPLATLPGGSVTVERRGRDVVEVGGKRVELDRYSVGGVVWGRETLWFDAERRLIAAITLDAEFNRFEAIREGFEAGLPFFVARASEDGMAVLAEIADRLGSKRPEPLAIVGATLVDGTGAEAVEDSVVIVVGDRINAAGPRARVAIPFGAKVLDAGGLTLLPGLWEMHAHVTQVEWGPVYLAAGVTTARDCANEFEFITAARDAIASGRGLGPRLIAAGLIDGEGRTTVGVDTATTPEQARRMIRRYADAGFPQIKIYNSLKPELVAVIAREAHRRGMSLTGHIPAGMDLQHALEAGMDQVNHIYHVTNAMRPGAPVKLPQNPTTIAFGRPALDIDLGSDRAGQVIRLLEEHGTVVDPTVAFLELINHPTDRAVSTFEPGITKVAPELAGPVEASGVPPGEGKVGDAIVRKNLEVLAALHKAGIPIVAGTDGGVPGHSLHRELELYVQAGMTPLEAIRSATVVPAHTMKLDGQLGTVEPGKLADLILVAGRPDRNISDIRKVKTVVTNGRAFDCAELWKSVGFRP